MVKLRCRKIVNYLSKSYEIQELVSILSLHCIWTKTEPFEKAYSLPLNRKYSNYILQKE